MLLEVDGHSVADDGTIAIGEGLQSQRLEATHALTQHRVGDAVSFRILRRRAESDRSLGPEDEVQVGDHLEVCYPNPKPHPHRAAMTLRHRELLTKLSREYLCDTCICICTHASHHTRMPMWERHVPTPFDGKA